MEVAKRNWHGRREAWVPKMKTPRGRVQRCFNKIYIYIYRLDAVVEWKKTGNMTFLSGLFSENTL